MIYGLATFGQFLRDNWAVMVIASTSLSLVAFCVHLVRKYVRICLNIFMDTPTPLLAGPRDFQIIRGEEVRFRSFDGTSLRGMWVRTPNKAERKGTIVFCHEYGSDMYSCARYTRPLIETGFDVFTFDFRGHGDSSCPSGYKPVQWPSDKELEDVLGACAYVEDELESNGDDPQIGLFGMSRGGGAAILAAGSDRNIACILCDSAFGTRRTTISFMKRWAYIFARVKLVYENHPDAFWRFLMWWVIRFAQAKLGRRFPSVRKALKKLVSCPVTFFHGQRDSYIRYNQAQVLYDAAEEPKDLWIIPKAKHNQGVMVAPAEYAARTIAFFRKFLAHEAVSDEELAGEKAKTTVA